MSDRQVNEFRWQLALSRELVREFVGQGLRDERESLRLSREAIARSRELLSRLDAAAAAAPVYCAGPTPVAAVRAAAAEHEAA